MTYLMTMVLMLASMMQPVDAPPLELSAYPQVEGVVAAESEFYINETADLGEPNHVHTYLYEFDSKESATEAMPLMCEHLEQAMIQEEANFGEDANPVIPTEIGEPGDDRCAHVTDAYSPILTAVVRVENRVLVFKTGGVGGAMEPFVTEFFDGYLSEDGEATLELPTADDLPEGWIDDNDLGPTDILDKVNPEGTPAAN